MVESESRQEDAQPAGEGQTRQRSLSELAKGLYGSQFTGEVRRTGDGGLLNAEPAPGGEETRRPDAGTQGEAERARGGEDAGPAEDTGEAAAETEEEAEGGTEGEREGKEEATIATLGELIEANEWDPDWVQSLKVPVKVDGKAGEATLAELVKSYQIGAAAERRLEDAKAKAKAITDEVAQHTEELTAQLNTAAALVEGAEKLLDEEVQGVNWAELRQDDPAEYAARKEEIAERRAKIQEMKQAAANAYRDSIAKHRERLQSQTQERLQQEQAALLDKLPEWRDSARAKAEKAKLTDYLVGQGFSREDVMGASDHRLILLARKAMLYDEAKSQGGAARKKLAKVPKVMKPGASKPQEQRNQERLARLKARMIETGHPDDALAYWRAKRGGQ